MSNLTANLDSFEDALYTFGNKCDIIVAMCQGGKCSLEDAFQEIKKELAAMKKVRKALLKKKNESGL